MSGRVLLSGEASRGSEGMLPRLKAQTLAHWSLAGATSLGPPRWGGGDPIQAPLGLVNGVAFIKYDSTL